VTEAPDTRRRQGDFRRLVDFAGVQHAVIFESYNGPIPP
jgi:hypothetical protein